MTLLLQTNLDHAWGTLAEPVGSGSMLLLYAGSLVFALLLG